MLYVIHGGDSRKGRAKLHSLLDSLTKRKPSASLVKIDEEGFQVAELDELVEAQGLFVKKAIVVLDSLLQDKERKDEILSRLKAIAESENIFVMFEARLDKATLSKLEKSAEKMQEVEEGERKTVKEFDVFSLTDALGQRDSKRLFALYHKAKMRNVSDEEIHGILFWQIKSMLLSASCHSPQEAGLHPFVFRKSRGFLQHFSQEELAAKAGLHRTYISLIERGKQSVTLDSMEKLADALGVSVKKLMP